MSENNDKEQIYIKELGTFIIKTTVNRQTLDSDTQFFKCVAKYFNISFLFIFTAFVIGMLLEIILKIESIQYFIGIRIIGMLGCGLGILCMLYHIGTIIYLCSKHNLRFKNQNIEQLKLVISKILKGTG